MSETNSKHTNEANVDGNNQTGRSPACGAVIPLEEDQLRLACGGSEQSSRATRGTHDVKYITDSIE